MTSSTKIDTSNELYLYRHRNGIKLATPNQKNNSKHTVQSVLQLPICVYFIRADSINVKVNEQDARLSGFDSINDAIGKTCFGEFTDDSAKISKQNDMIVMRTQKAKISEEDVILNKDHFSRPTLSIKLPWYNDENKVIGLFGCSIIMGQHPLAESLSIISNLGILNSAENASPYIGTELNNKYLSKRQLTCANLLLAGMTQKEIAAQLNLSPRTIETYIENLRGKLNCRNKTELILKLSDIMKDRTSDGF